MKTKLKKWFLKWSGLFAFAWCLGCCLVAGIKGKWDECLVLMPFCFLWLMYWAQGRICDKLAQHNAELIKRNDDLSKLFEECDNDKTTYRISSQFFLFKYLNAQNDADLCKRKINCTDYLSKKRWYEYMIEAYSKILKDRGQNV